MWHSEHKTFKINCKSGCYQLQDCQTWYCTVVSMCVWIWASLYFWMVKNDCTTHVSMVSGSHVGTVYLACFLIAHQNIDRWKVVSVLTVLVGWTTDSLSSEIVLLYQGNDIGVHWKTYGVISNSVIIILINWSFVMVLMYTNELKICPPAIRSHHYTRYWVNKQLTACWVNFLIPSCHFGEGCHFCILEDELLTVVLYNIRKLSATVPCSAFL